MTRLLLAKTNLNIIALTSKSSSNSAFPEDLRHPRIKLVHDVDLLKEDTVRRAAEEVDGLLKGKKDVRLVVCLAGQVSSDRNIEERKMVHS